MIGALARQLLRGSNMRGVLAFIIIAGLGGLYLWQQKGKAPSANQVAAKAPVTQTAVASQPSPASTPPREVSEHNWMKRSLDRARDVSQQARTQTKESQNP